MHQCPGCDQPVPDVRVACLADWQRVPMELKHPLWAARRAGDTWERLRAVGDISRWLRANRLPQKAPEKHARK